MSMLSKWIDRAVAKLILGAVRGMTDKDVARLVPIARRVKEEMESTP
jgi:hypothetical protein